MKQLKSDFIGFRLSPNLNERIEELSKIHNTTKSEFIRNIVNQIEDEKGHDHKSRLNNLVNYAYENTDNDLAKDLRDLSNAVGSHIESKRGKRKFKFTKR